HLAGGHIAHIATRTPGPPGTRELVLRIKPLATSFGDTLALVLDSQGPAIAACKTWLGSGTQSGSSQGSFVVRQTGAN
ncbi:MAG: hypothetical protein ACKPKO_27490, partial [Candidatus Fonsibacter sp.]